MFRKLMTLALVGGSLAVGVKLQMAADLAHQLREAAVVVVAVPVDVAAEDVDLVDRQVEATAVLGDRAAIADEQMGRGVAQVGVDQQHPLAGPRQYPGQRHGGGRL